MKDEFITIRVRFLFRIEQCRYLGSAKSLFEVKNRKIMLFSS